VAKADEKYVSEQEVENLGGEIIAEYQLGTLCCYVYEEMWEKSA